MGRTRRLDRGPVNGRKSALSRGSCLKSVASGFAPHLPFAIPLGDRLSWVGRRSFLSCVDVINASHRKRTFAHCRMDRGEAQGDGDSLKRYRDMGVERVVTALPPEPADKTLPVLDRWAELIRRVNV